MRPDLLPDIGRHLCTRGALALLMLAFAARAAADPPDRLAFGFTSTSFMN